MKVLVAGGSGMIGSNVARILHDHGHNVFIADRALFGPLGRSLASMTACRDACVGMDCVFHLADRTVGIGYSWLHHGRMLTDSLLISLNLLNAAQKAGVKEYIYVSSSCVYSDAIAFAKESDASDVPWPETSNEGYGWAKRMGERQCVYFSREYKMRTVIARPANVYGPSYNWHQPFEDMHVIPVLICKMLRGEKEITVWGSGKQTRMFQHEGIAAQRIVTLGERGISGEAYNLGGTERSIGDLVAQLRIECDYKGDIVFDPSKPEGPKRKAQDCAKINALIPESRTVHALDFRTMIGAAKAALR